MKKKFITLLCALSVATILVACGTDADVTGEIKSTVEEAQTGEDLEEVTEATEEVTPEVIEEAETTDETEATEVSDDTTEASDDESGDNAISMGVSKDNQYENAYFAIGCKLDENWTFETEEQILARNQLAADMVAEKFASVFESGAVITDMVATHSNQLDTVNVGIEKLTGGAMLIDEKQYIELSDPQVTEMLESMGLEKVTSNQTEIELAGKTHGSLEISAEYSGVKVYEKLVVVKNGAYVLCITTCTWQENECDDILSNFYAIEE